MTSLLKFLKIAYFLAGVELRAVFEGDLETWKSLVSDFWKKAKALKYKISPQDFQDFLQIMPHLKGLNMYEIKQRLCLTNVSDFFDFRYDNEHDEGLEELEDLEEVQTRSLNKKVKIDCGHGGYDPLTNEYITSPSKMWQHKGLNLHNEGYFYEGVFNRMLGEEIAKRLDVLRIPYEFTTDWRDKDLARRIREINQDDSIAFVVSLHGNAATFEKDGKVLANQKAKGITVFVGKKASQKSQTLATDLVNELKKACPFMAFPIQVSERSFWVSERTLGILDKTNKPAILSENGFFTSKDDVLRMIDPNFIKAVAAAHVEIIKKHF